MQKVIISSPEKLTRAAKNRVLLRRQTGQTMPFGTVAIWLMALIFAGFLSITLFIGSYVHHKNQITYVAQQAARYGMNRVSYGGLLRPAPMSPIEPQAAMRPLLQSIGMPDATVEFTIVKSNGLTYGQATVTAAAVPVFGGGPSVLGAVLPRTLTISQTAVHVGDVPPFIACISTGTPDNAHSGCVQVPIVAAANPFNFGHSPAYFNGSIGGPGAEATGAPGYVQLPLNAETTPNSPCRVDREPYVAGPGWAY